MRSLVPWMFAGVLPVLGLTACSDSPRPYGDRTTPPPSAKDRPGAAPAQAGPTAPPGVPQDRKEEKQ